MFDLWRINRTKKEPEEIKIEGKLTSEHAKEVLGDSNDVIVKEVYTGNYSVRIKMIAIDGLIDSNLVDDYVLKPLTEHSGHGGRKTCGDAAQGD